ncbi:MAG: cell envelope integrity protein TolA [Deltaproteobacteria bacterium]|nr:cell envelope integrity protein TolA [Deltaproteobacteria bacterium]
MEAALRTYRRGLLKTVAGSFILHALLIAVMLIFYNAHPGRVYFTPVTVSIVDQSSLPKSQAQAGAGPVASVPQAKIERIEAKEEAVKPQKAVKTSKKAEPKMLSPVEEALKHISADVKEKDDSAIVGSSIEKLKSKHEAEQKALKRSIDEIRQGLSSGSTVSGANRQANAAATGAAGGGAAGGGAGGGAPGGVSDVKYASYYNQISGIVQQEWAIYFGEFQKIRSEVIVSIKIARSGSLMETRVEKSSGNPRFDDSLLNAVKKASPFPPLPKDFEGKQMDVSFRFCPDCEGKK